jgi:hypothetical protein
VRFDADLGVTRPLAQLAEALRRDVDWIREHSRQAELAARWHARGRPESLLLRGDTLDACKAWIERRNPDAPEITEVQRAFFAAREQAESARRGAELQRLAERERLVNDAETAQARTRRLQRRSFGVLALMLAGVVFGLCSRSTSPTVSNNLLAALAVRSRTSCLFFFCLGRAHAGAVLAGTRTLRTLDALLPFVTLPIGRTHRFTRLVEIRTQAGGTHNVTFGIRRWSASDRRDCDYAPAEN